MPMLKQDYYMKKLCKILSLLILCLAFTSKVKAQEDIFYKFDVKKNHIKVNCIIQGSVSGLTHLKIPVFFDLDRSQLEKLQIYIDGLKYKYTIGNNLITLKHKPLALLQISYQLHNIKGYDSNLYFYITPKFFFFPLQYCLFKTVSSLYKPYNIRFHFNTYNGKLFSNTLPSINNPFEGSFTTTQELEGLFFIGGEVSRYEVNNSRSIVFFSNEIKLNKQQIVEYISQIEAIHNNFFEKTNKNSHFIFLLNPKYKYDIEGSNVSNLETIALGTEVKFNYELKRVIAHENLHKWFNSKIFGQYLDEQGYNCWFIEGFTDYYTNYLNSKHNIITLNDYLNSYNKILANYYTSPFRYMTNSNISEAIHDDDIFAIAYWRGMIIAHELNFLIQNSTKYNNKLSLDEYIKYLIRLSGSSYTHFDLNILAKTLFDFTGHDFSNYIDNIKRTNILVNAQYILDNKAFLLLKETEEIIYDFDIAQSQLKWIVQGVNSDSESFQNGLRNKQKILNITTNSSGHLFFKVKDQNGTKTIKIPQKIKKVLIPQYKLIN